MRNSISSVSPRDISWPQLPAEREDFRESIVESAERLSDKCAETVSVVDAVLCNDELAVSNACRRAEPGTLDSVLCDDVTLQEAQTFVLSVASKAAELVLGAKIKK